jgi:hypothetical protein
MVEDDRRNRLYASLAYAVVLALFVAVVVAWGAGYL